MPGLSGGADKNSSTLEGERRFAHTSKTPKPARRVSWQEASAVLAACGILAHFVSPDRFRVLPLYATLVLGGVPLVVHLVRRVASGRFESDLLAGVSVVTAALVHEYLAGSIVVLMWSGGTALEQLAAGRASAALRTLAERMPRVAHRENQNGWTDIPMDEIARGDRLVVLPHETAPTDGYVDDGHGHMDESYLTGEPYVISKAPGSKVLSGALNGDTTLTMVATKRNSESRYSQILRVLEAAGEHRPKIRRLAERLGAWYTPFSLVIALLSWILAGDSSRFLSVLVVATPCPLLLAIPIAIIGSIGVAARRGIVIRNPAALETLDRCRIFIFDKTGTLTEGKPKLIDVICAPGYERAEVLRYAFALEQYSRHPLASAVVESAHDARLATVQAERVSEKPGEGLSGFVEGREVKIAGRNSPLVGSAELPPQAAGLECVVFLNERYAALFRFRDEPRRESGPFIHHLLPRHQASRIVLVSGDREGEVQYLAAKVGISEIHGAKSPEEKVAIVEQANRSGDTLYIGDGINDAPAMMAATVGVALGRDSDVTSEAADAVILDGSLAKVDELIHISARMRRIGGQSAIGGIAASLAGMMFAATGHLSPVTGAVAQEVIDLLAVLNALRSAFPPRILHDFE